MLYWGPLIRSLQLQIYLNISASSLASFKEHFVMSAFFYISETSLHLSTMLLLDCSSVLVILSSKVNGLLFHLLISALPVNVWSRNQVMAIRFKGIEFIAKQYINFSLQTLQDFDFQVGLVVCWINISIYFATTYLFKCIFFFFFRRYKNDCEVRDWSYPVESSIFIRRWHRGLRVSKKN